MLTSFLLHDASTWYRYNHLVYITIMHGYRFYQDRSEACTDTDLHQHPKMFLLSRI